MEVTLLAKILWFFWIFLLLDIFIGWTDEIPNKKTQMHARAILGIVAVITFLVIALLPFVNLLWK